MKRLLTVILICLMLPIHGLAVTYGKTGESTNFNGDVGVPSGMGYYVNGVQVTSAILSDVASIAMLDENEDITGAWTMSTGSLVGVDATEFGYLDGITEDIQTALDTILANVVEDTTPELGGEMDAGAHSIGFTLHTATGDGATLINWTAGNKHKFTFGAQNETITFTNPTNPCAVQMIIVQDGTGSRTITWSGMTIKWYGGSAPTLSTAASSEDIISFIWDGTSYYGQCSKAFATP